MESPKTLSNRNNAQRSTGPRTEEGKRTSSQNARKHGFTSKTRFAPHEDPKVYEKRFNDFSVQLNVIEPINPMQSWYVESIVHHTLIVDRLNATAHARFADACARSKVEHKESNAREVERLTMLLKDRPDTAVRLLRRTVEGCDLMIPVWESLLKSAVDREWDFNSLAQMHTLSGNVLIGDRIVRDTVIDASKAELLDFASPFWAQTDLIVTRTKICMKLFETQDAKDWAKWTEYYNNDLNSRREDEALRDEYEIQINEGNPALVAHCQTHLDELKAHREQLIKDRAALGEVDDPAEFRDAFDSSDEGKLIHRYRQENLRTIRQLTGDIFLLNRKTRPQLEVTEAPPEVFVPVEVASPPFVIGTITTGPSTSRNEPTEAWLTEPVSIDELKKMGAELRKKRENDQK